MSKTLGQWALVLAAVPTLVVFGVSEARAQSRAQPLTLGHALEAMRAQHPLLGAADAEIEAADADAVGAGLWTNPVLDASYTPGVVQSSYDPSGYISWGITQFFEVSDTPGARARAARLREDATRSDRDALANELSIEVEQAFVDACNALAVRELWRTRVEMLRTVGAIVETRVGAGAAPRYDASRFAIVLRRAETSLGQAEAALATSRGELRAAIGPGVAELEGDPVCEGLGPPDLPSLETLIAQLTDRPDLVAARSRASAADATTTVASRAVLPGFGLRLGGAFGQGPGQVDLYAGVVLPLPVIDYGQGTIRAAEHRASSAHRQVESLEISSEARLRGLYQGAVVARETESATASSRGRSTEMLDEARAGYESGQFSVLELADAFDAWGELGLLTLEASLAARHAELDLARELGRSLRGGVR
ncbi:MAG: TolC family protein [Sandaracinaceae bacterium]|nr:TolC family protein [Sandaracinaceae bacterium]